MFYVFLFQFYQYRTIVNLLLNVACSRKWCVWIKPTLFKWMHPLVVEKKGRVKLGVGQDVNQYIMPRECHASNTLPTTLIKSSMLLDIVVSGPLKDKRQNNILNRYWLSPLLLVQPQQPSMVSIPVPIFFIYCLSDKLEDTENRKSKERQYNG